jgi:hypothetical protein
MARHRWNTGIGGIVVLVLVLASCDKNPSRPTPLTPTNPPSAPTLARVEITAPASIPPGQSVQLTATAVRSDGSTEDVTAQAWWSSFPESILHVSAGGLATAKRVGEATISANYPNRTGTATVLVVPAGTYKLEGQVIEGGFGVSGVTLTVISGIGEGLTTTSANGGGYSLLGVGGRVRLHAKKEGYHNKVETLDVAASTTHVFEIVPDQQRANLAGTYSLTLVAACEANQQNAVPEDLRRRTYTAAVTQQGPSLIVTLSGGNLVKDRFAGESDPTGKVTFTIGEPNFYYYYPFGTLDPGLIEQLTPTSELQVAGYVAAEASSAGIQGRLDGYVQLYERTTGSVRYSQCFSGSHGFEMKRQ